MPSDKEIIIGSGGDDGGRLATPRPVTVRAVYKPGPDVSPDEVKREMARIERLVNKITDGSE